MSLGVTATRKPLTAVQLQWFRVQITQSSHVRELHLGACVGGDEAAFDLAVPCEWITIVVHPPINEKFMMPREKWTLRDNIYVREAKDYHARNRDIVDETDEIAAGPDSLERPHSGTWYTINYAAEQRKPGTICYPDGHTEPILERV